MRRGWPAPGPSLATLCVAGLDRVLQWAPPGFVVAVPVDGGTKAVFEVGVLWAPTEFVIQWGRVDRISQVMACAVGDVVEVVRVAAHQPQDGAHHRQIVPFSFCANQIRATDLAVGEDSPHRAVVVLDMYPVANV